MKYKFTFLVSPYSMPTVISIPPLIPCQSRRDVPPTSPSFAPLPPRRRSCPDERSLPRPREPYRITDASKELKLAPAWELGRERPAYMYVEGCHLSLDKLAGCAHFDDTIDTWWAWCPGGDSAWLWQG
jgi:hypothetical protein